MKKSKREDLKGNKIFSTKEKHYLADHGFYSLFYDEESRDLGRVPENMAYIELLRRGYEVTVGKIYEPEIDFICKKHDNRKLYFKWKDKYELLCWNRSWNNKNFS